MFSNLLEPHGISGVIIETLQELRMLPSVNLNCQVKKNCHDFRFSIVRIVNCNQCQVRYWVCVISSTGCVMSGLKVEQPTETTVLVRG